jgi:hypothetical protein
MIVSIKGFITCKSAEQYIDCADNYAVNISNHRFSVSDGVSKSYFPKVWSEILVSQFVERTDLKESDLIKLCQEAWQKRIDEIVSLPETKWFTKSQYNRKDPALATFVGLQFFQNEKRWSASALGDSFLFFVPDGFKHYQKELVTLSSKTEPIVFDNFPDYLTSIGESHKGRVTENSGDLRNGTFYLMTDALAEWFIKEGENAIGKITVWESQADFEKYVNHAIDENNLTNDDCAILCIEISEVEKNGIYYQKIHVVTLDDLINDQESKKKEIRLQKLEKEEIQKSKKLELSYEESPNTESLNSASNEGPVKENLISKLKKNILHIRDKEENKEKVLPEKKIISEIETIEKQNSEQLETTNKELSHSDTIISEKQKSENDNENTETEKVEPKKQPEVDSKTKNIFDKF